MNILFYTILFVIGLVIGSFWADQAIKLPKSLDMRKTHYSRYKHDVAISELTYILLGGITSVILANILGIHIGEIDVIKIIIYIFSMLYITALVLMGGIDRVYTKIEKRVLAFGIVASIMYMIYLVTIDLASLHLSAIYLFIYIVLLTIDTFLLRRYAKDSYIVNILMLLTIILAFTDLRVLTYTIIMAFVAIILDILMQQSQKNKNGNKKFKMNEISVGYFISASNMIVLFMIRVLENYYI